MVSDKSLANLRPNPSGRPKGFQLWKHIKNFQSSTEEDLQAIIDNPRSYVNTVISAQYVLKAVRGDSKVIEYIIDREEGKITQKVESNLNVTGLKSIGADIDSSVLNVVCTVKDSNDVRDKLLNDMNTNILQDNSGNDTNNEQ